MIIYKEHLMKNSYIIGFNTTTEGMDLTVEEGIMYMIDNDKQEHIYNFPTFTVTLESDEDFEVLYSIYLIKDPATIEESIHVERELIVPNGLLGSTSVPNSSLLTNLSAIKIPVGATSLDDIEITIVRFKMQGGN